MILIFCFFVSICLAIGERIGFDVIDINSESNRKPLARIDFKFTQKVGKYSVDIQSFESIAIPLMTVTDFDINTIEQTNKQLIIVIDEIGKMEAFSDIFRKGVKQLFDSDVSSKSYRILASIPAKRNIQMLEEIHSKYANREIHINRSNRNQMADRVVNMLCETAIR